MDSIKKHYDVVAAVIIDADEILCMQRGKTKFEYTSYKWEFPGGKVEVGETPEEALRREIREEMTMNINVGKHLITIEHEYQDFRITMTAYLCSPVQSRAFTMNEHHAFQWLKVTDLQTLDWAAADVGIVKALINVH